MRRLYDDLRGLGQTGNHATGSDYAERLGFVRREAAHPLVQHGGDDHVRVAVLRQILVRQLFQRADGGDVLFQIAALPVAHGDVLHALLRRQQRFDNRRGV